MIDWCGWCIYSCQHWYAWVGKLGSKGKGRGTKRPNSNCLETTFKWGFYLQQSQLATLTLENSANFHIFARTPGTILSEYICIVVWYGKKEMGMFIVVLLNVFEDMYQDLGISIQFLVQINMTVSHKRYLHTNTK